MILQNLTTTNQRKSSKSKYVRKLTELDVVTTLPCKRGLKVTLCTPVFYFVSRVLCMNLDCQTTRIHSVFTGEIEFETDRLKFRTDRLKFDPDHHVPTFDSGTCTVICVSFDFHPRMKSRSKVA